MANMTLSVPNDLREDMKKYPLKWSYVACDAFRREVKVMEMMDVMLKDSKLTEEDAERIGNKIKAEIRKRFK